MLANGRFWLADLVLVIGAVIWLIRAATKRHSHTAPSRLNKNESGVPHRASPRRTGIANEVR